MIDLHMDELRFELAALRRVVWKWLCALAYVLAAGMLLAALTGCASTAAAPVACYSPDFELARVQAEIRRDYPRSVYRALNAEERARFLKAWNESGSPTGYLYDTIGYFENPDTQNVAVLFIERGCIWASRGIPRALFLETVRGGTAS